MREYFSIKNVENGVFTHLLLLLPCPATLMNVLLLPIELFLMPESHYEGSTKHNVN